jgi:hypothetical protein
MRDAKPATAAIAYVHANHKMTLKQTIVKVIFWIDTISLRLVTPKNVPL